MLRIIAATRQQRAEFLARSPLAGCSSMLTCGGDVHLDITFENTEALPTVYNAALGHAADDDVVLFTHDDVGIDDWHLIRRLDEALQQFAVIGIVGNRRRIPRQCSWAFRETPFDWDSEFLSGSIRHVFENSPHMTVYGPGPAQVKLIDGVFMAARARTLREAKIVFDPRFHFNFYDLDFCRSCEAAGLSIGTWPIAITHHSVGDYTATKWERAYAEYLEKWGG